MSLYIICALTLLGRASSAHHSFAMYDGAKQVTLKGTVKAFLWVNPHVRVIVAVDAAAGTPAVDWIIEMSSPGNMVRGMDGVGRHCGLVKTSKSSRTPFAMAHRAARVETSRVSIQEQLSIAALGLPSALGKRPTCPNAEIVGATRDSRLTRRKLLFAAAARRPVLSSTATAAASFRGRRCARAYASERGCGRA